MSALRPVEKLPITEDEWQLLQLWDSLDAMGQAAMLGAGKALVEYQSRQDTHSNVQGGVA